MEHADCIVIGCVCLLNQCYDANAWFHGTRRKRAHILRDVAKRPDGKSQKRVLTDLLTLTHAAIGAASGFLKHPSTGSLPLTWNL